MNRFKTLISLFCAAALAGLSVSSVSAGEGDVILTVRVDEALSKYYKLNQFAEELAVDEEKVRARAQEIEAEGNALVEEFQELREQATSDILQEEARKEAMEDAERKIQEIQAKENELRKFVSDEEQKFRNRRNQQINLAYQEIAEVIEEISGERQATLVIDVTARAVNGRAPIMFTDGSYDITPEVIERVNATQGEEEEASE